MYQIKRGDEVVFESENIENIKLFLENKDRLIIASFSEKFKRQEAERHAAKYGLTITEVKEND